MRTFVWALMTAFPVGCTEPATPVLEPLLVIAPEDDNRTGSFNALDARGCRIVVSDHVNRTVHAFDWGSLKFSFGRPGNGPGEIRHIKSVGLAPDLSVAAIDWSRRRLLWWNADGSPRFDRPISHGPYQHALVGTILPRSDGGYLDYPLSGSVTGFALTPADTDSLPLVYEIDTAGEVVGEWGRLDAPDQPDAPLLRGLLQVGDMQAEAGSLYVFRAVRPRIEIFSLEGSSRAPVRSIELPVWFEHPPPREVVGRVTEQGTVEGTSVELNTNGAGPFARDMAGRFYVIMLGPHVTTESRKDGEGWWPREQLWVFDPDGLQLGAWSLAQRGTRMLRVTEDGAIVALARPSASEDDDWALIVLPPVFASVQAARSCGWTEG